eukprot:Hpha_TRINITY_DN8964_c0_g2::TRINITY_DN8964_c0_g2_i1::g.81004::m.81004
MLRIGAVLIALAAAAHAGRGGKVRSGGGGNWHLPYPLLPYNGEITGDWMAIQQEAGRLFDRVLWMNASVEVTGHIWMYPRQAQYYHRIISRLPNGTQMCEAGFGSGLSTLGYLRANPGLKLTTFDLWEDTQGRFGFDPVMHERKKLAEKELLSHFADRWTLVKGNSYETIPAFFERNGHVKCDVVHVDGNHTRGGVLTDLVFFQPQVAPDHLVLMDDLQYRDIQRALGDFSSAVDDAHCFRTDRRDLRFTGRLTSKKNRKNWCHFTFRRDWSPDEGYLKYFHQITGRDIPPSIVRMAQDQAAKAKGQPKEANKHQATGEGAGAEDDAERPPPPSTPRTFGSAKEAAQAAVDAAAEASAAAKRANDAAAAAAAAAGIPFNIPTHGEGAASSESTLPVAVTLIAAFTVIGGVVFAATRGRARGRH